MTWPVPDKYALSTPYGKRGSYWSCNQNSQGQGIHTGADFAAPAGTKLYATIAGEVRHRNYGSAFGNHQFAISPDPGQPFAAGEVFYAHARKRVADGTRVKPGDYVGEVGDEGNVTGAHLHYEFHPTSKGMWGCSLVADPAPTLEKDEPVANAYWYNYSGKPKGTLSVPAGAYKKLDAKTDTPPAPGLEGHLIYFNTAIVWKAGATGATIRVKYVRADGDATGYQSFAVTPRGLLSDQFLVTHDHWESGDEQGGVWHVRIDGDVTGMTLGTRYAKIYVVRK